MQEKNEEDISNYTPEADAKTFTPLMLASANNQLTTVKSLIKAGENVNARSLLGSTPVMFAAQRGHYEMVVYLVSQGGDLSLYNKAGIGTITYASQSNNLALVQWLVEEKKVMPTTTEVNTALLFAADSRNFPIFAYIFQCFSLLAGDKKLIESQSGNSYIKFKADSSIIGYYLKYARIPSLLETNVKKKIKFGHAKASIVDFILDSLAKNSANTSLKKLQSTCTTNNVNKLMIFLKSNSSLENLSFPHEDLDPALAQKIFLALAENPNTKLKILDLESSKIGLEGALALAEILKTNITLEKLNLAHCKLGPIATTVIIQAINNNPAKLRKLNLTYNMIGVEGGEAVANLLNNQICILQSLSISANHNLDDGILPILNTLKTNNSLLKLDCSCLFPNNSLIIEAIVELISVNNSLKTLDLGSNDFSDMDGKLIVSALKTNLSLEKLSLGNSGGGDAPQLGVETAKMLGEALKYNRTLKILDLLDHKIFKGENYLPILEALKYYNVSLVGIEAGNIEGYKDNIEDINLLLERNKKLASDELQPEELKKILDEIKKARVKKCLTIQPDSLRLTILKSGLFYSKIDNTVIRKEIRDKAKCEIIYNFSH